MPTQSQSTILIVDDAAENLTILADLLQPLYRVRVANSGEKALRLALTEPLPDLILLDVVMPDLGGFEVLQRLRRDFPQFDAPVIFVTSLDAREDEKRGLALGAVDYLTKPLNPDIVLARVQTHLELQRMRRLLARENDRLEKDVLKRLSENLLVTNLAVQVLASLAEVRDNATGNHVLRTQAYVEILARHLARQPSRREALPSEKVDLIVRAAPLHDIGKVGLPDAIVSKTGRLTPEEFEVMKTHTTIGAEAIRKALDRTLQGKSGSWTYRSPQAFELMRVAEQIARCHHEHWDGSGYPAGLAENEIPLPARLMTVADVCDALQNARAYRPALDLAQASRIISEGRGTHFDPDVVDAFLVCRDQFAEVELKFAD